MMRLQLLVLYNQTIYHSFSNKTKKKLMKYQFYTAVRVLADKELWQTVQTGMVISMSHRLVCWVHKH